MGIKEKLTEIISNQFEISKKEITNELKMGDIEKWDSLGHINLMVQIEMDFEIMFEPEDLAVLISFDLIFNKLSKLVKK